MEILYVVQLPDGQPILTVRRGEELYRFTFTDKGKWFHYPQYDLILDKILHAQLNEILESLVRDGFVASNSKLSIEKHKLLL